MNNHEEAPPLSIFSTNEDHFRLFFSPLLEKWYTIALYFLKPFAFMGCRRPISWSKNFKLSEGISGQLSARFPANEVWTSGYVQWYYI